jgi:glycosyltransferase involved in cell wall biosynthesis
MPEMPPRPAIADASLSMILVASNAELFLDHLLDRWLGVLKAKLKDYEIVLVDDASTDASLEQAKVWQRKHPELTVVQSEPPHGVGAAWRAGLIAAKPKQLIGFAEFSPDYNPDDFNNLFELLNQVDLVSGIRTTYPSRWSGRSLLERWVFGVRLTDAACPFKLSRRSVFDHLPLQSRGDFVHTEVVAKANFLGCLLAEAPVEFHRTALGAADPYWQQDMRLVFRSPDFGPPPQPGEKPSEPELPATPLSESSAPAEEEVL